MDDVLAAAAQSLLKREHPRLVAATGLIFRKLEGAVSSCPISSVIESHRGGVWGDEGATGAGYPILRSTNMRGARVDVVDPAWCIVLPEQAERYALETGDILITKSSGSSDLVGKSALFIHPSDGNIYLFSNFTLRLRPNQEVILPEFLAWFLRSPQSLIWRFENQQNAVGLRNLQTTEFLEQPIPVPVLEVQQAVVKYLNALEKGDRSDQRERLPAYLDDQRRIVARIEELAAKIEEALGLRRKAAEETELLVYLAARQLRTQLLDAKPVVHIGELATVTSGGTPDRANSLYWDGGTIPWIKTGELTDGSITDSEEKITEKGMANSSAKLFPVGTVLIALYGQGQTRGRTGLLKIPATTNQACAAILPQPKVFDSCYLQHWLRSLYYEMRLQTRDGAQPNWNGRMIKNIRIALPPLEEQRRIVAYLDELQAKVDAVKWLQTETLAKLDALLPSVLDRAFKGEL